MRSRKGAKECSASPQPITRSPHELRCRHFEKKAANALPAKLESMNREKHEPHEKGTTKEAKTQTSPSAESFRVFRAFRG